MFGEALIRGRRHGPFHLPPCEAGGPAAPQVLRTHWPSSPSSSKSQSHMGFQPRGDECGSQAVGGCTAPGVLAMGQFLICKEDDSQPQDPAGAAAWPRFLYRSHSRDLGRERSGPACTRRPRPSSYEETGARSAPEVSAMSPPPRFLPAPTFQAVLGSLLRMPRDVLGRSWARG